MFALDFLHLDLPLSVRSFVGLGLTMLSLGISRSDLLLSLLDKISLGPFLSIQSFACCDLALLVLDLLHLDSISLAHSSSRLGFAASVFGIS